MEGVNMPASLKFAWRWIVGATAATIMSLVALPGVGHASELSICINNGNGRVRGINVLCLASQTELGPWETIGPQGPTGAAGPQGPRGITGQQGQQGPVGANGPAGAQGAFGPQGAQGLAGVTGSVGPTGPQGAFGPQGPQGVAGGTGPTGPSGNQGISGIKGLVGVGGVIGVTGVDGTDGTSVTYKTFLTGGSLGTLGEDTTQDPQCTAAGVPFGCCTGLGTGFCPSLALSSAYLNPPVLLMGPGNGAVNANFSNWVPMNDDGSAYNLFVRVDNHPGIDFITGAPISYLFGVCQDFSCSSVLVFCYITDPDTTCNDLYLNTGDYDDFLSGDIMAIGAATDDIFANTADVTWSLTYDKEF